MCSLIKPTHCCKGASQVFCLDSRAVFVDLAAGKPLDENFPCLCTIMGLTIAKNWEWTPMCCANWATIKVARGSPILGSPSAAPAPAASAAAAAAAPVEAEEAK